MNRLFQRIESSRIPSFLRRLSGRDEIIFLDMVPVMFVILASAIMIVTLAIRFIGSLFN